MSPDQDPGWFSGSMKISGRSDTKKIKKIRKRRLANYLENSFNGILIIFHRLGPRAPDPDSDPETGSTSLLKTKTLFIFLRKNSISNI